MPLFESEGIVLRSYSLSEADRIVVFFTRDHGMIRGVAKGAKRMKSKFGSTLELFSTVNIAYFQKDDQELVSIQQAELARSRFEAAADPEYLHTFSYLSDLLIAIVPPHDPSQTIYRMTAACMDTALQNRGQVTAIRLYFEVWLLRLGGFLPDWTVCGDCGTRLSLQEAAYLRADLHLVCESCRRGHPMPAIEKLHRQIFQGVQSLAPQAFVAEYQSSPAAVDDLSNAMRRHVTKIVGRDLLNERTIAVHP